MMIRATIGKLLLVDYLLALMATLGGAALLYAVFDLLERLNLILRNDVTTPTLAWYLLYKLPLIAHQTLPAAAAIAFVITLIQRHRHREIIALASAGVTPRQIALPFILVTGALCILNLLWAETIVPPSARAAQELNLREIKKRDRKRILAEREIWLRSSVGILHVSYVDRSRKALLGVTAYELDDHFRLVQVRYFPSVLWTPNGWAVPKGEAKVLHSEHDPLANKGPDDLDLGLPSRFEEFAEFQREPEELSLSDLWKQHATMRSLGLPANRLAVDLYLKTSLPFAPLALILALMPATLLRPHQPRQFASVVVASALIGFGYWLMTGVASSIGYAGALPAALAAWITNLVYGAAGFAFLYR